MGPGLGRGRRFTWPVAMLKAWEGGSGAGCQGMAGGWQAWG